MLVRFFQENLSIKLDFTFCPFGISTFVMKLEVLK
jgi:hypothetical protein